jgi:hypothetical protein
MVVLSSEYSPGAGPIMLWVLQQYKSFSKTTLSTGAPEEGFLGNSFSLLMHASASLAANWCYLESKITGAGVSPDYLISAPHGVVGSGTRIELAY